jgi:hypothetical protein
MATSQPETLLTSGAIARLLRQPLRRVLNILATRPHIQSVGRAGVLRLYDAQVVAMVRHELNAIDARRCRRTPKLGTEEVDHD